MILGNLTCVAVVLVVFTASIYLVEAQHVSTRRPIRRFDIYGTRSRGNAYRSSVSASHIQGVKRPNGSGLRQTRRPNVNHQAGGGKVQDVDRGKESNGKTSSNVNLFDFECGIRFEPPTEGRGRFKRYIAGGYNAGLYSYPSYLKLTTITADQRSQRCGGTLISRQHVLTAKHCFDPQPYKSVLVESTIYTQSQSDTISLPVSKVCHLPINGSDVSLIKLKKPLEFTPTLQPACLPEMPINFSLQAVAIGLGAVYIEDTDDNPLIELADELQALPVRRIPCAPIDKNWQHVCFQPYMDDYMGDTCRGDSGGGIFMAPKGKQTLVALTSHGPDHTCREGEIGYSVNANLYSIKKDILRLMNEC